MFQLSGFHCWPVDFVRESGLVQLATHGCRALPQVSVGGCFGEQYLKIDASKKIEERDGGQFSISLVFRSKVVSHSLSEPYRDFYPISRPDYGDQAK